MFSKVQAGKEVTTLNEEIESSEEAVSLKIRNTGANTAPLFQKQKSLTIIIIIRNTQ